MLHCGARQVERGELALVPTPEPTATWFPVGHETVIATVSEQIEAAGFIIQTARFGLSRGDARMFATMDLSARLADEVTLAIGIRNSTDKSLPLGFVAGSRVFCCDNLAFRSDLIVARKHTRNGEERFVEAISLAVGSLNQFQQEEKARIEFMQHRTLTNETAESLMLRAYEAGIVSHRLLPGVIGQWRKPSFPEFEPRTAWTLFNAFTTVLGARAKSNPQQHAALTIRLGGLFNGDGAAAADGRSPFALEPPSESAN
jgi:hypothetical protein